MPNTIPHMPASIIAHSCPPIATARVPSVESKRNHSPKQVHYNCTLSCSSPNIFHRPTTTSNTALGLHATASTTRTSPTASGRPAYAHAPTIPIPEMHFASISITSPMPSHIPPRTPTRPRAQRAMHMPAFPIPTATRREPATRGEPAPQSGSRRGNTRPTFGINTRPPTCTPIDHLPTPHRTSLGHRNSR